MKYLHFDQSAIGVWELFYNTSPNSQPINGTNVSATSKNKECFLYNCMFIGITTHSAISFEESNIKFLSSDCSFHNCSSDTNGGSIYFNCSSSIVQYRSCGYKSKTISGRGHHSCVELVTNTSYKNYIYECSFYDCGNLEKSHTNYLMYGYIEIKKINTSFCEAKVSSGIYLYEPTDQGNVTHSSFCNTTSNYVIFQLNSHKYNFNFCNVLNNKYNEYKYGTFYAGSSIFL